MNQVRPEVSAGVIVASCGHTPGAALAEALAKAGQRVAWLHDGASTPPIAGVHMLSTRFDHAASLAASFAAASEVLGQVSHVVFSAMAPGALTAGALAQMDHASWSAISNGATKALLFALQAGFAVMPKGGVFTLVGPNIGLVGSDQLTALCTSLEGQRSLAKAAARQWGGRGFRVNWVGVAPQVFDPAFAGLPLPQVPELGPPPPALGRPISLIDDVLPVITFLGSSQARAITGHSFNIDGGDWMLP